LIFKEEINALNLKYKMKIVILSRNRNLYSTKKLLEAGQELGHEMHVLDHLKCSIVIEKANPHLFYEGLLLENVDAIIPRIGASVTYYGAAVIRQFEMQNVFSTVSSQSLVRSRDKLRSMQLLSTAGLGMPKTAFTNFSNDSDALIKQVGGVPLIIKLLEGTQGLGVVLAETKKAASSVIEAFNGLKARVIVQEFIAEAKGADIRALVVGDEVVGAMKRQGKEGEFRSNLHRGGSAQIIELSEEEKKAAIIATKTLGLKIAGVDMLQSERGPLILEVNSSPGLKGIQQATNIDIAKKIIQYVEKGTEKLKLKEF
jgi:ribosomal protein S6--L-glutamate ligase